MAITAIDRSSQIKPGTGYDWVVNAVDGKMSQTAVTASKAVATDSNGLPVASATTATELGYVNGVTSAIQTQIDALAYGLSWKNPALVATTAELTQAYTQTSATILTETDLNGGVLQDIDAHTPVNGDRILVKNELTTKEKNNGIYTVTNAGVAGVKAFLLTQGITFTAKTTGTGGNAYSVTVIDTSSGGLSYIEPSGAIVIDLGGDTPTTAQVVTLIGTTTPSAYVNVVETTPGSVIVASILSLATGADGTAWVLTRSVDMNTWAEVPSASTFVEIGTANADIAYVCTSNPGGTLGTTAVTFVQFSTISAYTAGNGINITGSVIKLADLGTSGNILVGSSASGNPAASVAMSGEATIINTGAVTLSNAAVIGKVLTGWTSGAGTVANTDSILAGMQKIDGNVAAKVAKAGDTMTGALTINPVSNQLVLGGVSAGYKVTISSTAPSADRVLTIPAATGNRNFLLSGEAAIVTGDISASAGITLGQLAVLAAPGNIIVGAASTGVPTSVAMSADATIAAGGALTIASSAVTFSKTYQVVREPLGPPTGGYPGTIFTTAHDVVGNTECVYLNGLLQQGGGADYTFSSTNTITFVSSILSTDLVLVNYWRS